ncbi:Phosphodiest-domain-containing protein [Eremomyces bilateralis CBS 781.70]|uniref:Phosphodiest-domain-containing protein n=1 Tax=Eremomyces bilateralis CBS 781.70 TaxID=1392243 RepID=A0A6G1G6R6_9PEZI|nr:Phosphodiest-domain-containing protein [Eremomyces bilateralis CBS 781.70]KAF1813580.1 Phosphodiest-domain-containing protein [Eremomyces bilateralis CBS 781.70]
MAIDAEKSTKYGRLNSDDVDSDSERRAPSLGSRASGELHDDDRVLLQEEDEQQELLLRKETSGIQRLLRGREDGNSAVEIGKRERRRLAREARQSQNRRSRGQDNGLMYEMEEGGPGSDFASSRSSSESDLRKLSFANSNWTKRLSLIKRIALYLSIIALFLVLLFAAYKATQASKPRSPLATLSNGTSLFAPTTIIVSLDGFRADFLQRGLTPTLNAFVREGISPLYMTASFPSVTFPNHFTLVTGLYPETHGIVGNTFWDPDLQDSFYYTDKEAMDPKWWNGEPIWVTAEKQSVRSAIHMWPGSEAHIGGIEPTFVDKYNGSEILSKKVDRVLELLDLPGLESSDHPQPRPQLIAAYIPVVDSAGHKYGPNSTDIRQTIQNVDNMLAGLFNGLEERNLTDIVNVVVVSDHGMATTSTQRLMQLEDLVDVSRIEHIDGWPLIGLRPKDPADLEDLYNQIKAKAETNPHIEVYLRDRDMPERYHFRNNDRIAPLWIVPEAGWAIVKNDEFNVAEGLINGDVYHPLGLHGYDPEHPLMRAIFVARGPAFPHKPDSRVEVFQNTEVYNIICESIGIVPSPNNGTLHLPLKPIGLHSDEGAPTLDPPNDPPPSEPVPPKPASPEPVPPKPASPKPASPKPASPEPASPEPVPPEPQPDVVASSTNVATPPADDLLPTSTTSPGSEDATNDPSQETPEEQVKGWIDWVHGKLDEFKSFVNGVLGGSG